jgi:hypothetical protein
VGAGSRLIARLICAASVLCIGAAPRTATAADAPVSTSAKDELASLEVSIEFAGVAHAELLAAKTASWFASGSLRFSSREQSALDIAAWLSASRTGLRVLVDGSDSERLRLWFVLESAGARRYLTREQVLPTGLDEIGLENVAQLIFSSALALAEGREETPRERVVEQMQRPLRAAPEVKPNPTQTSSTPARTQPTPRPIVPRGHRATEFAAAAGYELRFSGPQGLLHGPLLSLGISQKPANWERTLAVAVTLFVPSQFEQADYAVKTRGYSARLEGLAAHVSTATLQAGASAGLGADWLWLDPQSLASQQFTAGSTRRSLRAFASVAAGLWLRLGALRGSMELECVAPFSRAHYDVEEAGVRRESVRAWPLLPALRVALHW